MEFTWFDLIGITGVAIIVVTYFLLQLDKLSGSTLAYAALNAGGALLIMISLTVNFNLAAFVVELFWFLISVLGMVRRLAVRSSLA